MLLVDTYNVLHTSGVLPPDLAGLDADDLAGLIASSRYGDRLVKLICDGSRSGTTQVRPGVEFLFSGPGREADELIERIIRANSAPKRLLVVSSDRRVVAAARRRRAATLSSDRFLAQLAADRSRPRSAGLPAFVHEIPLDRYSVAAWMREFGLDSGDLEELRRIQAAARVRPSKEPSAATGSSVPDGPNKPSETAPQTGLDPVLRAAQQEWPGQVGLDDLDMRKWLGELHKERGPRPVPPRGRGRRAGS